MSIVFEPLPFEPNYRKVASAIAARIMNRSLRHGEALPTELSLAEQFGVNRSTVREALRELESGGLVARRKGTKRLVVARPATADVATRVSHALALQDVTVAEVWETLSILEPAAAEAAARRRASVDLDALRAAETRVEETATNTRAAIEAVGDFFRAIAAAGGNRALMLAQEPLLQLLQSSLEVMLDRTPRGRSRIAAAQRKIIEAIEARDAPEARLWMEKHIRDFRRGFDVAGIDLDFRVHVQ